MSVFILDTRNQKDDFVVESLTRLGHTCVRNKLPFGDIALSTDILNAIDLKSSGGGLIELAKNCCSNDHDRMKREIMLCKELGGKLTFLCFEPNITCIDDIQYWKVPTFASDRFREVYFDEFTGEEVDKSFYELSPQNIIVRRTQIGQKGAVMTRVSPITLMKVINTMSLPNHYAEGFKINFEFTTKEDCGNKILEIFKGVKNGY